MNGRLKSARKALGLTQSEFASRLGVTNPAISKLEKGERNFTDQMVIAVCREYGINETWLRTGDGEMFTPTENALISQLSEQYNLDGLDQKILETYINLPESHRRIFKDFALKLASVAANTDVELSEDITPDVKEDITNGWNKGLSEEEAVALLRQRYADAKKDGVSFTTSAKVGST